jgi:monoamine oxidase
MPNLYTSLLARRLGSGTLAPKQQRPPIPKHIETRSQEGLNELIFDAHRGVLDEMVGAGRPTRSVGIVGAGLAGLSAAYELRKRGYSVSVFEASDRPGGRTWSTDHLVRHHVMDRGAELIGSNHPLWLNYADNFKLGFSDVLEYSNSPILLGKTPLTKRQELILLKQMGTALDHISARAKRIVDPFAPWTDPQASDLDSKNVRDFIMRSPWPGLCKTAVLQQLESDNGVPAHKQSLLGLLAMVRGGGMERYWEDTEVYRCRRGTQALSLAFVAALQGMNTSISYNNPVTSIDATGAKVRLQTGQNNSEIEFDDLILAIPPSTWQAILGWLPNELLEFIGGPPQMGKNTKLLLAFRGRFWKTQGQAPSATLNGPVDQTWETTESYPKPEFGMVAFSGADHAESLSQLTDHDALASVIASLERVYKKAADNPVGFEFVNWPKQAWAKASYSFPDCGDIMTWGPKFSDGYEGKVHFAGEHTCYAFTGYMEGALQSGFRLARKLVFRDGGSWVQRATL